jgi:ring-1,2-phenylacetyl-CoA epoxidase subunit PaaE
MSIQFHPLKVSSVVRETPDAVSICFEVPEALQKDFQYRQGQNIAIRMQLDGQEIRRNYSICASPRDARLRIGVKQIKGGLFSTYANTQIKAGDILEVMPPVGNFYTELDAKQQRVYVAFAAGSGITPVLSLIKATLEEEPLSQFLLVYGNRNRAHIMFREELEELKNRYLHRFQLIHVLSREKTDTALHDGRIDADKCRMIHQSILPLQTVDAFFICGPQEMIEHLKSYLQAQGISSERIHYELFHADAGMRLQEKHGQDMEVDLQQQSKVSIKLDGVVSSFELPYQGATILQAALAEGIDLPFACKGGMCCTCRAHLDEGQVDMDRNYALGPEELNAGFILTCQSHPRTERVFVNFDLR